MKKQLAASLLCRSGLRSILGRALRWSGVLILNYHRIGDGTSSKYDHGLWSATEEDFAKQLRFCKSEFDVISPADLPSALSSGRGRFGLITFDDGYRDNYEAAFPILKSEGVPATFFIATGFIDNPQVPWWDEIAWMMRSCTRSKIALPGWMPGEIEFDQPVREQAVRKVLRLYKSLPVESTAEFVNAVSVATETPRCTKEQAKDLWMTWDMIRAMRDGGMTIGGHTVSHIVLARADRETQRVEINECKRRFEHELGQPMRCFSYPVGQRDSFDETTSELLRESGVEFAFSYYGGICPLVNWNAFDFPRVAVESYHTFDWFRSIVSLPKYVS